MLNLDSDLIDVLQGREQWEAQLPMLLDRRVAHNKIAAASRRVYVADQMATNKADFLARCRANSARYNAKPEVKARRSIASAAAYQARKLLNDHQA